MLEHSEEIAALVSEDVAEVAKEVVEVAKNNYILLGAVAIGSIGIGAFVGYRVCATRLSTKYDRMLAQEVAETREFYRKLSKSDEYSTPAAAVDALIPEGDVVVPDSVVTTLREYQGREKSIQYDQPHTVHEHISIDTVVETVTSDPAQDDNFNYADELQRRRPDVPFVISFDEFTENEPAHEQVTYTYYEGDDVLTDDRDSPVEDVDDMIGIENLARFGHGSRDRHTVFVRNLVRELDFEVVRSKGGYAEEVLGHLTHSKDPIRRFRRGDDG